MSIFLLKPKEQQCLLHVEEAVIATSWPQHKSGTDSTAHVGWQRAIKSVGGTWRKSSAVGKWFGLFLETWTAVRKMEQMSENNSSPINLSSSLRLCLLHIGLFLLRAGRTCMQTSGSRVGIGRPALLCLAFSELWPVWRRVAERRQRALSHQQPQGALWRHPWGRSALIWFPQQDEASLRCLLL